MISLKATDRPPDPRISCGKLLRVQVLHQPFEEFLEDPEKDLNVLLEMRADRYFKVYGRPDEFSALFSEIGRFDLHQEVFDKVWSATARR